MRRDSHYLRCAAAAIFLALGAYMTASFAEAAQKPETVTALKAEVSETVCAEGTVLRDEVCLTCPFETAKPAVSEGAWVSAGELICENGSDRLYAPCAGYFCGSYDGWECLSCDDLSAAPCFSDNTVGRIVKGGWYFVAEPDDISAFYEGQALTLTLSKSYSAVCCGVDGGRLILRCREGLEDVLDIRFTEAKISICSVTGFKLPLTAVFSSDGEEYVTVLKAGMPKRAQVKTLYVKDDYCLVESTAFGEGAQIFSKGPNTDKEGSYEHFG